jgi:hypothetical protein
MAYAVFFYRVRIRQVPGLNIAGDTDEFDGFHDFTQSLLANFGIVP